MAYIVTNRVKTYANAQYTQIVGELGKVLDFSAPAEFRELVATLSGWLSGLDVLSSAKCLGLDSFHATWRLVQLA